MGTSTTTLAVGAGVAATLVVVALVVSSKKSSPPARGSTTGAPAKGSIAQAATGARGWGVKGSWVVLKPGQQAFLDRMRSHVSPEIPILVTSGFRTAGEQAAALIDKRRRGESLTDLGELYGNDAAITELLDHPESEWASTIQRQMNRNVYLSRHQRGDAIDLRIHYATKGSPLYPAEWIAALIEGAKAAGAAKAFHEKGGAPHIHIEGGMLDAALAGLGKPRRMPYDAPRRSGMASTASVGDIGFGGATGAGLGALVGTIIGGPLVGAAVGAVLGGGTAAIVGGSEEEEAKPAKKKQPAKKAPVQARSRTLDEVEEYRLPSRSRGPSRGF